MNYRNAVEFGYGKEMLNSGRQDDFRVNLLAPNRDLLSPSEEAAICAREISTKISGKPLVCLSGGLDSEIMALSFLKAEVPFEAAIIKFNNDLNRADIIHAEHFCQEHDIKANYYEFDIIQFFERRRFQTYCEKYFCASPELAAQMHVFSDMGDRLVIGGEAFRSFFSGQQIDFRPLSELEAKLIIFFKKNLPNSTPNFHYYSSELAWSFFSASLKNPASIVGDDHDIKFYQEKELFYKACGFDFQSRPNRIQKLHGFEGVKNYFDELLRPHSSYQKEFREPLKKLFGASAGTKLYFDRQNKRIKELFLL